MAAPIQTDPNRPAPVFAAVCARGVEPLLAIELSALGASVAAAATGEVRFSGAPAIAYRACLWSRLATRILQPLAECEADPEAIYACARALDWPSRFAVDKRVRVDVSGHSPAIAHSGFAALRVKDGIVDGFRATLGRRPDSGAGAADVVIGLRLHRDRATLALDLAGDSLHRRGYRTAEGAAPLKETLAAAILVRAGWPAVAAAGGALLDPMCGSGTLVIEAALMAADIAPGLQRAGFAFQQLRDFDAAAWQTLLDQARRRRLAGLPGLGGRLFGSDADPRAVAAARANADRAGLGELLCFELRDLLQATPPAAQGLLITNPPYGERLGGEGEVIKLLSLLGARLRQRFGGWRAAVFTARPDLAPRLGLRADSIHALDNGPISCKLLCFGIPEAAPPAAAAEDFVNRLAKNLRHLGRWARRTGVSCYRAYDADLPDYALALDLYATDDDGLHAVAQEYAAPATVDPVQAERRLRQALVQIAAQLELSASRLHLRVRQRQRGTQQYQRQSRQRQFHTITEHGCRLRVNFDDYLDTGLFLDHRPLRRLLGEEAAGKRFLNLFCYTAAATVHAAVGGAAGSLSVDLSATYLDWARDNLAANGAVQTKHALLQADVIAWLRQQALRPRQRFDLILCDPPTFSNSKRMGDAHFDVQRDHAELLGLAGRLLTPGGVLYFSNNRRRFKLDPALGQRFRIEDITARTLDQDFARPPPPHHCWRLQMP
ncbi:MAG: bifunctional 23S rRNA (guanine(2069)-N(7))-methyltransferase RlmK/23S rRNA (guanine(2445)-N(2))-methyltransferase RlmL [Gammaproteobacteria bacterium]|nr:bifunctional 23S rRNA (guanine(2069)-N(7))-methyltransferase RlmK/23S rRNA (guanine(2445)-N(2))-methyltransferase RlmL [Gammaproteobacteria bacterium]